jgi:hypothetical protein
MIASFWGWLTGQCAFLWHGSSPLSSFNHLLEMAFGSGVAYAALIRVGRFQGGYIAEFCNLRFSEVEEACKLLAAEDPSLTARFNITHAKSLCDHHVAECRRLTIGASKHFAIAGVVVSVLAVILILIAGIWDPLPVPNVLILIGTVVAFAPVPVGLIRTYYLVQQAERRIANEYKNFFVVVDFIRDQLKQETQRAIQEIDKKRNTKNPGLFQRLISGH